MATEYKITYTYTGQGNTSANRSVSFSRFKASGDVDRNIGQITSIKYEHYHSSTKSMTWGLNGRLVFADGSVLVSDRVYHEISGSVTKYTNTFETLPTAEQFAQLAAVETLDTQDKTSAGGYYATLYWRANSDNPMRLIVTFIEEPPITYAPKIDDFEVIRSDKQGAPNDEGASAAVNLKISIGDAAGLGKGLLRIYYAANTYPVVGESEYIELTHRVPEFIAGVSGAADVIPGEWSPTTSWYYAVVFIAGEENDVATYIMPRYQCSLHVAEKRGGACVCGFAKGTPENPMFESYAPGYFYAGIHGVTNYATEEVETGGKWIDGKPIWRRSFVFEGISIASGTNTTELCIIDNFAEINAVINITGAIDHNNEIYGLDRFYSTSSFVSPFINSSGSLRLRSAMSSTVAMKRLVCTIEYTKV